MDFNFGNRLKELRVQAGLTQQQLANQMSVSKSVISYYELNTRTPSPEIIRKLATIFHVSSDYLLGIEKGRSLDITGLDEEEEKIVRLLVENFRSKKMYKQPKK